jgi:hypothetical protein
MKIVKGANNEGWHFLDENNIIVSKHGGYGDSLGRTAIGLLCYDEDRDALKEGIRSCFSELRRGKIFVCRYPKGEEWSIVGNSRDHVIKTMAIMKYLGEDEFVKEFLKKRTKHPSSEMSYTLDQKLYFKSMYSRFWGVLYATYTAFMLKGLQGAKWLWRKLGGRGEDIFPTFAAFYTAIGVIGMKSRWARAFMRSALKPHFEKSNLVGQLLCGGYVTKDEVRSYVPTRRNRWSTHSTESDRDLTTYPGDKAENNVELALLYYLYENPVE